MRHYISNAWIIEVQLTVLYATNTIILPNLAWLIAFQIGQAARISLEQGLHINMRIQHLSQNTIERYRQIWWTVYILDRQMSSLLGSPVAFADSDVSAHLPSFSGSVQTAMGLSIQVRLSKAITVILQSKSEA